MKQDSNNKYFTPSIEDIRVGYEYEAHRWNMPPKPDEWEKMVWGESTMMNSFDMSYFRELCREEKIRVPYLTKEQIEAEGWETEDASIDDQLVWGSKFRATKKIDDVTSYRASFERDNRVFIQMNITNIESNVIPMSLFSGECKDINTFRYICKLLNI